MTAIVPIDSMEALDEALVQSRQPLVLFKHSTRCEVSCSAHEELERFASESTGTARVALVLVVEHREVSDAVSARLGVRHESPQAIVWAGGRVTWHASHGQVTVATLARAVQEASPAAA